MTKALLTWKREGIVVEEVVTLVPDGVPIYDVKDGETIELPVTSTQLLDNNKELLIFEGDEGLFAVKPEWVVSIELLDREDNILSNENRLKGMIMNRIKKFIKDHPYELATAGLFVGIVVLAGNRDKWYAEAMESEALIGRIAEAYKDGKILMFDEENKQITYSG
jgi:hypothetical protein